MTVTQNHNSVNTIKYKASTTTLTQQQTRVVPFTLTQEPRTYQGYINGYRQPVALLNVRIHAIQTQQFAHLQQAVHYYFQKYQFTPTIQSPEDVVLGFAQATIAIQKASGLPIFDDAQIEIQPPQNNEFIIYIPILFAICFHPIALFLIKLFNHHLQQTSFTVDEKLATELAALIDRLKMHAPQGINSLPLLHAAFEQQIPWRHLARNTFQYGYGRHSRWLDSTFTDKTAHIPAVFAESKRTMSYFLAQAGFPITEHYLVNSELEACAIADKLGYPVVVKPLDRCGGIGVFPHLISQNDVKKAFHQASQFSKSILLEKHVFGKDYRILVLNGSMFWAIERIPAGVTGDGVNSIKTLAAQDINENAVEYLAQQGFTLSSVPKQGQFIALSRIANVAAGGTPVAVFEKVHPDNQKLMEAAAKLLRLDFVGIDFITPDITRSYREVGGTIIEINVQPQLGAKTLPTIYQKILANLVVDQGRIPIFVIYGKKIADQDLPAQVQTQLQQQYKKIGLANSSSAMLNGALHIATPSLFAAGQHLLSMDDLDALIYCVTDYKDIEAHGLPFDRYDQLFFAENMQYHTLESKKAVLNTLFKACIGDVVKINGVRLD